MKARLSNLLLPLLLSAVCSHCSSSPIINCTEVGDFILPESCHKYYKCVEVGGDLYIAYDECPVGSLFDDFFSECREESLITSPLRCMQNAAKPTSELVDAASVSDPLVTATNGSVVDETEDSANVTDLVPAEIFEGLSLDINGTNTTLPDEAVGFNDTKLLSLNDTEDVVYVEEVELTLCDLVNTVDSYTTLVISSPSLERSVEYQNQFNGNIMNYNRDLEQAQNSTSLWRHGNSILREIKSTYYKASGYRDEFKRKLKINERLVQDLSTHKTEMKLTQNLERDIKNLQEEINNAETALAQTDQPAVRQYFERVIRTKQREIIQKQRGMGSTSRVGLELEERISFLEFVMDDAGDVESTSSYLQQDMETLLASLRRDNDAFAYHANEVSASITFLTTRKEMEQKNILDNEAQHGVLEKRKESLNGDLDLLNGENANIRRNILELTEKIANDTYIYYRKRDSYCQRGGAIDAFVNENSTAFEVEEACNELMRKNNIFLDTSEEENQKKQLEKQSRRNHRRSSEILDEIGSIIQTVRSLYGALPAYETRLQQIKSEIGNLLTHANDIKALRESITAAIESLLLIEDELQGLHNTFQSFTSSFQDAINHGRAAGSEDEKHSGNAAISLLISDIEYQLDQLDFTQLSNCRTPHQVIV